MVDSSIRRAESVLAVISDTAGERALEHAWGQWSDASAWRFRLVAYTQHLEAYVAALVSELNRRAI
jgi:hypothetical protein